MDPPLMTMEPPNFWTRTLCKHGILTFGILIFLLPNTRTSAAIVLQQSLQHEHRVAFRPAPVPFSGYRRILGTYNQGNLPWTCRIARVTGWSRQFSSEGVNQARKDVRGINDDDTAPPGVGEVNPCEDEVNGAAEDYGEDALQDDRGTPIGNSTSQSDLEVEVASFEFAPPMTIHKFQTMQDRRVPVLIKYTGGGGFKRYFEEIVGVLKKHFPDVIIDREIVEAISMRDEEVFEIRVDGKLVYTKRRGKGVYLHMETIDQAIRKARQWRRPGAVVYGDKETYKNAKPPTGERMSGGYPSDSSANDSAREMRPRD